MGARRPCRCGEQRNSGRRRRARGPVEDRGVDACPTRGRPGSWTATAGRMRGLRVHAVDRHLNVAMRRVRRGALDHPLGIGAECQAPLPELVLQRVEVLVRDDAGIDRVDEGGVDADPPAGGRGYGLSGHGYELGAEDDRELRRPDPVALGEERHGARRVRADAGPRGVGEARRELEVDAGGARLPPARALGEHHPERVAPVQRGERARAGRGAGAVVQVAPRPGVPAGGLDEPVAEARERRLGGRPVVAGPAHDVPAGVEREQHAVRGHGARPLMWHGAPQLDPHPRARGEPVPAVAGNAASLPGRVALPGRVPREDPLRRRDRVEELGGRRPPGRARRPCSSRGRAASSRSPDPLPSAGARCA